MNYHCKIHHKKQTLLTAVMFFLLLVSFTLFSSADSKGLRTSYLIGRLDTGATASIRGRFWGNFGLQITGAGTTAFTQPLPVQIELYRSDANIQQFSAGYVEVQQKGNIRSLPDH